MKGLDLYCGGGGTSMGMYQAGIKKIVGIDIKPQSEYPFEFIQSDVFNLDLDLDFFNEFDIIASGPPCQGYLDNSHNKESKHPRLVNQTREMLLKTKKPFFIENVEKAPIRKDLMLCGEMFNLGIIRHRFFEIEGFICYQPKHLKHKGPIYEGYYINVYSGGYNPHFGGNKEKQKEAKRKYKELYGGKDMLKIWQKAMGINWITSKEVLKECIPPAYSKYIIEQFLKKQPNLFDFIRKND